MEKILRDENIPGLSRLVKTSFETGYVRFAKNRSHFFFFKNKELFFSKMRFYYWPQFNFEKNKQIF